MTRVCSIGCGFFAPNHLHAWSELPGVTLAGVCDLDPAKAQHAGEQYRVANVYTDAETMLSELQPDLVDIVTTMASHRALVELCARHGRAMIVQKPFGPNYGDCAAMVDACNKAGVMLMVHENFRFQEPMRKLKAVLQSGEIGDPLWARLSFRTGYDVKAGQPYLFDEDRFIVLDLGIHLLDLARFFLGEVDTVFARLQRVDPRVRGEDMATIVLGHANGATCVVDCTYESRRLPDTFPQSLVTIEGTRGAVELQHDFKLCVSAGADWHAEDAAPPPRPWTSQPWHVIQDSVYRTQAHAVDAFTAKIEPETSGRDNLKTYALVDAAYESASAGKVVSIK